jgi:dTMP kinase
MMSCLPAIQAAAGLFVTFEGADGCGKTTQMKMLAASLSAAGYPVVVTQEPGGTDIGRKIRAVLLSPENTSICSKAELLLYFAARAQNFHEIIRPAWERGAIVLSDRFTDSTLAYQAAGRGLDQDVVLALHNLVCDSHNPDLTLCIDVDRETARSRALSRNNAAGQRDRMDEESEPFHNRVRNAFLALAEAYRERVRLIDGRGTVDEVADRIWRTLQPALRRHAARVSAPPERPARAGTDSDSLRITSMTSAI